MITTITVTATMTTFTALLLPLIIPRCHTLVLVERPWCHILAPNLGAMLLQCLILATPLGVTPHLCRMGTVLQLPDSNNKSR